MPPNVLRRDRKRSPAAMTNPGFIREKALRETLRILKIGHSELA
jgi:hypothetical protein